MVKAAATEKWFLLVDELLNKQTPCDRVNKGAQPCVWYSQEVWSVVIIGSQSVC